MKENRAVAGHCEGPGGTSVKLKRAGILFADDTIFPQKYFIDYVRVFCERAN